MEDCFRVYIGLKLLTLVVNWYGKLLLKWNALEEILCLKTLIQQLIYFVTTSLSTFHTKIDIQLIDLAVIFYQILSLLSVIAKNTQVMVVWMPGHYTNLPEPCNLFAIPSVVTVYRVSLPVLNINFLHSTKHQLNKHRPTDHSSMYFNTMSILSQLSQAISIIFEMNLCEICEVKALLNFRFEIFSPKWKIKRNTINI